MPKTGVICKIEQDCYYILTPQGDFERIPGAPARGAKLGDRVRVSSHSWRRLVAVAAALALIVTGVLSLHPGRFPSGSDEYWLALDVNPSIGFKVSETKHVTEIRAYNESGETLLASLELAGEELYTALGLILAETVSRGFVAGDVVLSKDINFDLDIDLLAGALESRELALSLRIVELEHAGSGESSPLREVLSAVAAGYGRELSLDEPGAVAAAAAELLPAAQVVKTEAWQQDVVAQYLVEKYQVGGELVAEMLESFKSEDVALILDYARGQHLSPREVWEEIKGSGKAPAAWLETEDVANGDLAVVEDQRQSLDQLASAYQIPAGRLSSLMRKGYSLEELTKLLAMAGRGQDNLTQTIKAYEEADRDPLFFEYGQVPEDESSENGSNDNSGDEFDSDNSSGRDGDTPSPDPISVDDLMGRFGVNRGEITRLTAKGYQLAEVWEVFLLAERSGQAVRFVTDQLESSVDWRQFIAQLELQPAAVRDIELLPGRIGANKNSNPGRNRRP
ncbi:MAG: hypothetical protein FH749_09495 [Firmicutes bacterium]|nr:hypothetical protein [Bacillota bacterium]